MISWQNSLSEYEHKSVAATFESQLEDLEQKYPDASNLLKMLAYFDPESIPLDLLITSAAAISSPQPLTSSSPTPVQGKTSSIVRKIKGEVLRLGASDGKDRVDETNMCLPLPQETASLLAIIQSPTNFRNAIKILQAQCLATYQGSSHLTLRISDLIQLAIIVLEKTKKSGTHQQWFDYATQLACQAFKQIENHGSPAHWPQCKVLIPHILSLAIWQDVSSKAK